MPRSFFVLLSLLFFVVHGTCGRAQNILTHGRQQSTLTTSAVNTDLYPFYHGVASGDPLADRVIIWTRVTPDSLAGNPVSVHWRVATDPELQNVVAHDSLTTDGERDYTVKVDVTELAAGTTYYYGFTALGYHSLTGRTKTTPTETDHVRLAVVSCANFQAGYFNAYRRLAERNDLDAVVHLGDYIYEYKNFTFGSPEVWDERVVAPDREIRTLEEYRTRYSTYRLDEDLLRMHQQQAVVAVWDDHESANDSYEDGANNHTPGEEGSWEERKAASRQAWFEWMPVRERPDERIYRSLRYGELAELVMLDSRLEGREQQIYSVEDERVYAEDRTMLGEEQRTWLLERLESSTARWKLIGQQVMFSPFNVGWSAPLVNQTYEFVEGQFMDIWDGYPAERSRIANFIAEEEIDNVVVLSGDFHTSFAYEVADPPVDVRLEELDGLGRVARYTPAADYDPATGAGAVAVEYVTPSITASNFDENSNSVVALTLQAQLNREIVPNDSVSLGNPNPHMKYAELTEHGYYILDVREDGVRADFFYGPVLTQADEERFAAGFRTPAGTSRVVATGGAAPGKEVQDAPAPDDPPALSSALRRQPESTVTVLALSPNPARGEVSLRYALRRAGPVEVSLLDAAGRVLRRGGQVEQPAGLYTWRLRTDGLAAGTYLVRIVAPGGRRTLRLLVR